MKGAIVRVDRIAQTIRLIRGEKVMLDADLAALYGVSTKRLNEQVRRNRRRFPRDFMFRLTSEDARALRSHFATSNPGRGGRRNQPFAFTEHGAIMLASILNSDVAVEASIHVVRAFVRLRQLLASDPDLARKLAALEKKYDAQFKVVFDAIRELMSPRIGAPRRIGFRPAIGPDANAQSRPSGRRLRAPSRRAPGGATR